VNEPDITDALLKVFDELIDGAATEQGWLLNPSDPGLVSSLEQLPAKAASTEPSNGGASIAAHVEHLRYGLELLNRWLRGDKPFADTDYKASWTRSAVSNAEWESRLESLRQEAHRFREALKHPRAFTGMQLAGLVASVAHLAYHLGAIRQIDRSMRGPSARD
jgi:hypothetical protein